MNRKSVKLTAIMVGLICITSMASCGKDVQRAEESDMSGGLSITEGTSENNEEQETEISTDTNSTAETTTQTSSAETIDGTSTTSTAKFTFVTGTRKSVNTSNPQTTKKSSGNNPSTTRTPSGNTPVVTVTSPGTTIKVPTVSNTDAPSSQTTTVISQQSTQTTATTTSSVASVNLSYYEAEVLVGQTIRYPEVAETFIEIWTSSDKNVATVDAAGNITGVGEGNCIIKVTSASDSNMYAEVKVTVKKQQGIQQIDGFTYVNGILIANKTYSLPASYNPQGLMPDTYSAFQELVAGAANDGMNIYLSSGFRSYETQEQIYNNYVYYYGQETADTFSARPGYSEHQTGMAIDVNTIDDSFAGTPEAIWLEQHCTEYGFIIRYPQGKESITGYKYEPWHIRYVGKEVAQAVKDAASAAGDPYLTLEEYLGIDSYYH